MKKTIIILSLFALGGCATSGDKEELHHLLHISEKYAEKTYKQINTLVDQKKLDEQKLNLFNDFLSNL